MNGDNINLTKESNENVQNNVDGVDYSQQIGGGIYGNVQYQQTQMNNNQNVNAPNYILWLILGIVQITNICCCNPFTSVCGIITVILAIKANKEFLNGKFYEYQANMKVAKILNILGWCLVPIGFIIWIICIAEVGKSI